MMGFFTVDEYLNDFYKCLSESLLKTVNESFREMLPESIHEVIIQNVEIQNLLWLFGTTGIKNPVEIEAIDEIFDNKPSINFLYNTGFISPFYTKEYITGFILTKKGSEYFNDYKKKYSKPITS